MPKSNILTTRVNFLLAARENTLPVDKSYRHLSGISIQRKKKNKTGVLLHQSHKSYLVSVPELFTSVKNNVVIDSEMQANLKGYWQKNITKEN